MRPKRISWLVSFAHRAPFLAGQKGLVRSAMDIGKIDHAVSWTRKELVQTDFYRENKRLLDRKRGAGYWAWKPYVILEQLRNTKPGDFVVYHDSGSHDMYRFKRSIRPLLEWCEYRNGGLLPGICHPEANKIRTKRDCFVYMGCDEPRYWNHRQVQAGFSVWQNNPCSIQLITDWLAHCTDARLLTDAPNTCGLSNLPGFKAHRHDQSILTNLVARESLKCHEIPRASMIPKHHGRISPGMIDRVLELELSPC